MILGPLALGAPWGLLALAALPTIVAIHMFRRRSPPRAVAGLFLWPQPTATPASGRRRERVVALPSLWLELLAALALAWWLADIHPAGDDRGRHLVVVLDDRQRVQARLPAGDTPAERLRAKLQARCAALRASDRVTVIASGSTPQLLCGPAAEPQQAHAALAAWHPQAPWHELDSALTLATQLVARSGTTSDAEIVLASDRVPDDHLQHLTEAIGYEACGEALQSAGLAEVRWLRDAAGERLLVRIYHSGGTGAHHTSPANAIPRTLEVRAGDQVLARMPDAQGTLLIPLTSVPAEELTVVLTGPDPLPFDDAVTLLRPQPREVRVAVSGPFTPAVQRVLQALPGVQPGGASPDLVIAERDVAPPGSWGLRIAPAANENASGNASGNTSGTARENDQGAAVLGPFLRRAGHPLCVDLDGTGLLWVGGLERQLLAADATELVGAGAHVLFAEQRRGRDRLLTVYADPTRGTLLQHPFWPALLANVITARRTALPGVTSPNVSLGQAFTVVLPAEYDRAELRGADNTTTLLQADADGVVLVSGVPLAGDWLLSGLNSTPTPAASKPWQLRLRASALDQRLGDLAQARSATREPALAQSVAIERRRSPAEWLLPLVLAAGAAVGAWWFFGRGR